MDNLANTNTLLKNQTYRMTTKALSYRSNTCSVLSKRELQILKLLAEGKNDQDISDLLFISTWTVKDHRKSVLRKLNAHNTAHAIYTACKTSLI